MKPTAQFSETRTQNNPINEASSPAPQSPLEALQEKLRALQPPAAPATHEAAVPAVPLHEMSLDQLRAAAHEAYEELAQSMDSPIWRPR